MRLIRGKLAHLAVEAAVVREMDRVTIQEYGLPGAVLMENAALAATPLAAEMLSGNGRVLVLARPGNNPGDGSGPLRAPYGEIIDAVNRLGVAVLAIDIPSGLDADTGQAPGAVVKARTTITFALPKTGLYRGVGANVSGEIVLGDIEMPRAVYPEGKLPEPR